MNNSKVCSAHNRGQIQAPSADDKHVRQVAQANP